MTTVDWRMMFRTMTSIMMLLALQEILSADGADRHYVESNYRKKEAMVPMRDGTRLYTAVYEPADDSVARPVLMVRTPYSCSPYGEGISSSLYGEMRYFAEAGYVIVFQNVRGRYMSEGDYVNVRPFIENKTGTQTDEASDTYDTVEWILENTSNNGSVGVYGVSYPGFYATMAALSGHPAIKAVSPQAPVLDWYMGDDAHHNGVFMLLDTYSFGGSFYRDYDNPCSKLPPVPKRIKGDSYSYFLDLYTMDRITASLGDSLYFWNMIMEHPDYDDFWKEMNPGKHLRDIAPAVMVVGGTFDTDDCYGALNTYKIIKDQSPDTDLYFVYGPWYHGGWHDSSYSHLGDIWFGEGISEYFMKNIEYPFFRYYLEGKGECPPAVSVFPSGGDGKWRCYPEWPATDTGFSEMYLSSGGFLSEERPSDAVSWSSYLSDPRSPVPYTDSLVAGRFKQHMTGDQRFASSRKDVLSFTGSPLADTLKVEGPLKVKIYFSSEGEDADIVVKLIDVYPDSRACAGNVISGQGRRRMEGYQMLVRGDVFRARYRKGFENPTPLVPGAVDSIEFVMNDVAHWFLPGHRVMVQVQSSCFPLYDINPQSYISNIYRSEDNDFVRSEIKIYHQNDYPSGICIPVAR